MNNVKGTILELGENEYTLFCKVQIGNSHYMLSFEDEVEIVIDGHLTKLWLGNGTSRNRNVSHICFAAPRDVRILTWAVYERINGKK